MEDENENNNNNNEINIHGWTCGVNILELKRWVDAQVENGKNEVSLDISWGYYNDIDGLKLIAKK